MGSLSDIGLENIDKCLSQLTSHSFEETCEKLSPLESAKLKISLAYGLASLQYIILQLENKNDDIQLIKDEISRVKDYVQNVNELEKQVPARKVVIDDVTASRIVQFELNKNISEITNVGPRKRLKQSS